MARPWWLAFPIVLLPWALAEGCRAPTQVTLDIRTDANCTDLSGVDIIVTSESVHAEDLAGLNPARARSTTASTSNCSGPAPIHSVGTLVVTPDGDRAAIVVIAGIGVAPKDCLPPDYGPQCIVARRTFAFSSHLSATLPIELDVDCRGIPCGATSTCLHGQCVDADVDCGNADCSPLVDASVPIDGTTPPHDATVDAPPIVDASVDAPVDSGKEAGVNGDGGISGSCKALNVCLQKATTCPYQPMDNELCCYENPGEPVCAFGMTNKQSCAGPAGCCTSAEDCPSGVCCASSPIPSSTVRFSCKPQADCLTPQEVCRAVGVMGQCGGSRVCTSNLYDLTLAGLYKCQ